MTATTLSTEILWGIPADQRGLYGQDFFYGAWLTDSESLLNLPKIQQELTTLQAKSSLTSAENTRKKQLEVQYPKRMDVLTTRAAWPTWLMEAPVHARCQWCGRTTRWWTRALSQNGPKPSPLIVGESGEFTDTVAWRLPSQVDSLGLCPSCGLMVLSAIPNNAAFTGVKTDAKIVRTTPEHYQVVAVGSGHWWEWPWDATPALWTFYAGEFQKWSRRYWVHQAIPTWHTDCVAIWYQGVQITLPGAGLRAMQHDAVTQVDQLFTAWTAGIAPKELNALSQVFSEAARSRWAEWLQLSPSHQDLLRCFWIPTISNLKKTWESS